PGAAGLAAGASLTVTQQVIVPAVGTGPRYFGVLLDSGNQVVELNETNNTAFAVAPLNIVATDLRVAQVTAPANATFGQTVPVTFVVTNAGSAAAAVSWVDRLYLSTTSNTLATLLTTANAPTVPLAPASSYTNTVSVTLPLAGSSTPGQYFLVVAADHGNDIAESDESNNLRASPMALGLPPLPDLTVVNILSPSNAQPGQTVSLVYTVTNRGSASAGPVWSETVYLATNSAGAGAVELATWAFTNTLPGGVGLARTQAVVVPAGGSLGNLWFTVLVDGRADVIESNEANNLGAASHSTLVPAVLTLQLSAAQVNEGASQPVTATVTRNGSRAAALTVSLINGDPTEVSLPAQVVIPAGQGSTSLQVQALLDGIVDGPQSVTIGATAPGFEPASAQLTVLDVDLPTLTVAFVTNQVLEGQWLQGMLSRDAGTEVLVVTLTSSSAAQLGVPANLMFAAGETSVPFTVNALDDTQVESPLTVAVTATANGYRSGTANVTILDDDWPAVTLTIAPDTFSESAGPQAAR
ncbi:MAG TPA: CARDB domain-containing protein, partial [Verrucomicrobiae bacterium]